MSSAMHGSVLQGVMNNCKRSPELYPLFFEYAEKAKSGYFKIDEGLESEINYIDLYLQEHRPTDTIVVGCIVSQLHTLLSTGDAELIYIEVGKEPPKDAAVETINTHLNQLPKPWRGEFWGELADFDGVIYAEDRPKERIRLEVGRSNIYTLWNHLYQSGSFARWPYGSKGIYLFRHRDFGKFQEQYCPISIT